MREGSERTRVPTALLDLTDACRVGDEVSFAHVAALRTALHRRGLKFRAVGDSWLLHQLSDHDRTQLTAAIQRGEVELAPYGAPHLLHRVVTTRRAVLVSRDRYPTLRAAFPGLDGHQRALTHRIEGRRAVLAPAPFDDIDCADASRAARVHALRELGYGAADHDLLRFDWRCLTTGCVGRSTGTELPTVPRCVDGAPICPFCDRELQCGAPVEDGVAFELAVRGAVRQHVTVGRGLALTLGRGAGPRDLDVQHLLTDDDGAFLVAREHLVVANHDGRLTVRDAGSAGGTRLRRAAGGVVDLQPTVTTVVAPGDSLVLGGVLELRAEPRRWPRALLLHPDVGAVGLGPSSSARLAGAVAALRATPARLTPPSRPVLGTVPARSPGPTHRS